MTGKSGQVSRPKLVDMKVRLPAELREKIEDASTENGSSMNGEVVDRLEQSFQSPVGLPQFEHLSGILQAIAFDIWRVEQRAGKKWNESRAVSHAAGIIASEYFDFATPEANAEGVQVAIDKLDKINEAATGKIGYLLEVGALKTKPSDKQAYITNALLNSDPLVTLMPVAEDAVPFPPPRYVDLLGLISFRGLRLAVNLHEDAAKWALQRGGEVMPEGEKAGVLAVLESLQSLAEDWRDAFGELEDARGAEFEAKAEGKKLAASLSGNDRGA